MKNPILVLLLVFSMSITAQESKPTQQIAMDSIQS
jgi:hypothetical protein